MRTIPVPNSNMGNKDAINIIIDSDKNLNIDERVKTKDDGSSILLKPANSKTKDNKYVKIKLR